MNNVILIPVFNQPAGIGTLIGLGVLILVGLGFVVYFTVMEILDRPNRKAAAEGNAWVDAVREAKLNGDTERLAELTKRFNKA